MEKSKILSGVSKEWIEVKLRIRIMTIVFKNVKGLGSQLQILRKLNDARKQILGPKRIRKIIQVSGRYYYDLYTPSWPSKAFDNFILSEISRIHPLGMKTNRFTNVLFSITKKCGLKCEHCSEWDSINKKEKLSLGNILEISEKIEEKGSAQIQLMGGEPMLKVDSILEILNQSNHQTEYWILSSGANFTLENAKKLKKAGLTGVAISLDHFIPELHNAFRGSNKSFDLGVSAIKNAKENGIVTTISICVTKSFIGMDNLYSYLEFAKSLEVDFIQILEPKSVGNYQGKEVLLNKEDYSLLDSFYLEVNYSKKYGSYPIICYHGYHQRNVGCFGAGNRNIYIDTDGDIQACPFCQKKCGSALGVDFDVSLEKVVSNTCHSFNTANI